MWNNKISDLTTRAVSLAVVVVAVSVVGGLLEAVVAVAGRSRLIDLTGVLLERPLWLFLICLWAVFVYSRIFQVSFMSAVDRVRTYVPLALIAALVNVITVWIGWESTTPAFLNVLDVPVSLLTFGWWPRLLASPGTLVTCSIIAVLLAARTWSASHKITRVVYAALLWLVGTFGFFLLPSVVAWAIVSVDASPLTAGPNVLARSWVALSQEGYWWHSVIDRFPGVLEGEAESSVRFLRLSFAWLLVVFAGIGYLLRQSGITWKELVRWCKPVRGVFFLTAAFFGLWLGRATGGVFMLRAVDVIAWLLFLTALVATWGVSVWRNDVHDHEADEVSGRTDRSLVAEAPLLQDGRTFASASLIIILVSGWLLGWPVLLPLLVFLLLQELLAFPTIRWKSQPIGGLILASSFVCVAISGVLFSLRTAAVPLLRPGLWVALVLFYLLHSLPKALRWSPVLAQTLGRGLRLSPRFLVPITLALSYLCVPLFTGWAVLWWIALPCAVVSLLPLLSSGRWDERKIVGWQTAFILISFLLLAARPSP